MGYDLDSIDSATKPLQGLSGLTLIQILGD